MLLRQSGWKRKTFKAAHTQEPRVINVDKNAAYPPAVDDLKAEEQLCETTELRQVKYLNNLVELSAPIHQRTDSSRHGVSDRSTQLWRSLQEMEAMHMRTHWTGGSC